MTQVIKFKNDERSYLAWCKLHNTGFVFNHFGGTNPQYNVLHHVGCSFLWRDKDEDSRTTVEKWCSADEASLISNANICLGPNMWKRCGMCFRTCEATTSNISIVESSGNGLTVPLISMHREDSAKRINEAVWVEGEPAVWVGAGEKEWKAKLNQYFKASPRNVEPACLRVEFRFTPDRIYRKDIDNLLTPVLESARDSGWLSRGFTNLGSVYAQKRVVTNNSEVGVQISSIEFAPQTIVTRNGILVEANIRGFDAESVKWAVYDQAYQLYTLRPELRFAPQTALRLDFRVTISDVERRKSIAALLKPSIDGLEPILGHPTNAPPLPRESLNRRLAPQDEMILELDYHIRGGNSNYISVSLSPLPDVSSS
jgi:hypothetical protein